MGRRAGGVGEITGRREVIRKREIRGRGSVFRRGKGK